MPEIRRMHRRQFAAGLGATVAVIGFDLLNKRWITEAEASSCSSFAGAPALDGQLVLDSQTLAANSHDEGNMVQRTPGAVLLPGSVNDIEKMIRYCRSNNIKRP